MKDLTIGRLINSAAYGAVLSAAGCNPGMKAAAEELCEAFEDCNPQGFAFTFSSLDECVSSVRENLQYSTAYHGHGCGDLYADWLACAADEYADECTGELRVYANDDYYYDDDGYYLMFSNLSGCEKERNAYKDACP